MKVRPEIKTSSQKIAEAIVNTIMNIIEPNRPKKKKSPNPKIDKYLKK